MVSVNRKQYQQSMREVAVRKEKRKNQPGVRNEGGIKGNSGFLVSAEFKEDILRYQR